jgi:hypothetical protein
MNSAIRKAGSTRCIRRVDSTPDCAMPAFNPFCKFQRRANCSLMAARPCEGVPRIDHAAKASSPRRRQALLESGKLTTAWIPPNPTQQTVVVIVMRQRRRRSRPKGYDRSGRKRAEDHPTHHFFPLSGVDLPAPRICSTASTRLVPPPARPHWRFWSPRLPKSRQPTGIDDFGELAKAGYRPI